MAQDNDIKGTLSQWRMELDYATSDLLWYKKHATQFEMLERLWMAGVRQWVCEYIHAFIVPTPGMSFCDVVYSTTTQDVRLMLGGIYSKDDKTIDRLAWCLATVSHERIFISPKYSPRGYHEFCLKGGGWDDPRIKHPKGSVVSLFAPLYEYGVLRMPTFLHSARMKRADQTSTNLWNDMWGVAVAASCADEPVTVLHTDLYAPECESDVNCSENYRAEVNEIVVHSSSILLNFVKSMPERQIPEYAALEALISVGDYRRPVHEHNTAKITPNQVIRDILYHALQMNLRMRLQQSDTARKAIAYSSSIGSHNGPHKIQIIEVANNWHESRYAALAISRQKIVHSVSYRRFYLPTNVQNLLVPIGTIDRVHHIEPVTKDTFWTQSVTGAITRHIATQHTRGANTPTLVPRSGFPRRNDSRLPVEHFDGSRVRQKSPQNMLPSLSTPPPQPSPPIAQPPCPMETQTLSRSLPSTPTTQPIQTSPKLPASAPYHSTHTPSTQQQQHLLPQQRPISRNDSRPPIAQNTEPDTKIQPNKNTRSASLTSSPILPTSPLLQQSKLNHAHSQSSLYTPTLFTTNTPPLPPPLPPPPQLPQLSLQPTHTPTQQITPEVIKLTREALTRHDSEIEKKRANASGSTSTSRHRSAFENAVIEAINRRREFIKNDDPDDDDDPDGEWVGADFPSIDSDIMYLPEGWCWTVVGSFISYYYNGQNTPLPPTSTAPNCFFPS